MPPKLEQQNVDRFVAYVVWQRPWESFTKTQPNEVMLHAPAFMALQSRVSLLTEYPSTKSISQLNAGVPTPAQSDSSRQKRPASWWALVPCLSCLFPTESRMSWPTCQVKKLELLLELEWKFNFQEYYKYSSMESINVLRENALHTCIV